MYKILIIHNKPVTSGRIVSENNCTVSANGGVHFKFLS